MISRPADHPDRARLAAGADVVLSGEPGTAVVAGVPATAVHVVMPVLPDGTPEDPYLANALLAARNGVARRQSSSDGGPVEAVYPHLAYVHGLWAATAALAALLERRRSGRGQRVVVDGVHGTLVAATTTLVVDPRSTPPLTAVGPGGPNPAYSTYRCADGRWLFLGALTDTFQRRAFAVLGVADVLADPRVADVGERLYAPENRGWVRDRIGAAFATRPRAEWLAALAAADCPANPVEDRATWLDHPQVVALGQRVELVDPEVGPVVMPGVPVDLDGPVRTPRPRVFVEDADWAAPAAVLAPGPDAVGGPLAGVRVLDLGTVLAGPYAGMLLAELGADVVKVEPVQGDAFRLRGYPHNRGMRGLALDLRSPAGADAFRRLVRDADVVIDNFRPGVLERLGADHARLAALQPRIVTASITGYGDVGPLAGRPGFDPVLQALSGMMAAQGGDGPPVFSTVAVNDVTAAAATAFGALVALWAVRAGRAATHVDTSLAAIATFMQSGELVRHAGRPPAAYGSSDHRGPSALSCHRATADGWVRLHAASAATLVDAGLLAAGTVGTLSPTELEDQLAAAAAAVPTAELVARVRSAGGWAEPSRTYAEVATDPVALEREHLVPVRWPDGRTTFLPHRYARFERTQEKRTLLPPGLGEHSRQILREAGLTDLEVDAMLADGTTAESGPLASVADVGYR
ncbi:CoA transferase [Nocardioides zeae]|uniref:CoA transferase n=1 Tax=Nocardioides imazamoxiresistens TaxID=3231893 RepID=A0ABU3PSE8_9ACTN|nr:CoA transferase [Nocardioides zeae]MDT9592132.1 CoA transferase [Nocardioides zeae]